MCCTTRNTIIRILLRTQFVWFSIVYCCSCRLPPSMRELRRGSLIKLSERRKPHTDKNRYRNILYPSPAWAFVSSMCCPYTSYLNILFLFRRFFFVLFREMIFEWSISKLSLALYNVLSEGERKNSMFLSGSDAYLWVTNRWISCCTYSVECQNADRQFFFPRE